MKSTSTNGIHQRPAACYPMLVKEQRHRLDSAGPEDIAAIRRIEADPRFHGLVGRWSEERHRQEMATPSSRYFVLRDASARVLGFALLQGFGDEDCKLHLKRIAVCEPSRGLGSALLHALLDHIYATTEINRIDLDLFLDNSRARGAYEKAGFAVEGIVRDYHRGSDGAFHSMWLMSVLRRDWESRHFREPKASAGRAHATGGNSPA